MSAWRDAAAECGDAALRWYDFGAWEAAHYNCHARLVPSTNTSAYLAGYYEAKANAALDAAEAKPPAPTRLDVALKALKRAERKGDLLNADDLCPCCGCSPAFDDFVRFGSAQTVTVKCAIRHEADCELAQALRWEVAP